MWIGVVSIIFIIVIIGWIIITYNQLAVLKNNVKEKWAQVDVQIKKRFDLIPNLVEILKEYVLHERETIESIIQIRNSFLSANNKEAEIKAYNDLSNVMLKIFILQESYPNLKANTNFLDMQNKLAKVEEDIASVRNDYNHIICKYNNKIHMIPNNVIANLFHFKKEAFFETDENEKENIQIKL